MARRSGKVAAGVNRDGLSRSAFRLLDRMSEAGAEAVPDPVEDGFVVVRGCRAGISLGRGTHPLPALRELVNRDLAARAGGTRGHVITAAGHAFLKRLAAGEADGGRFSAQHRVLKRDAVETEAGTEQVLVNARESPLAWLRRRRNPEGEPLIDAASFEAGERLRRDLTIGGLLPSVTARWDGAVGEGGSFRDPAAAADATVAARQRVRQALAAVGPDFSDLLLDLCGFLKGLENIERERRWPPRSGKIVARLALGQLARHYGLSNEASGPAPAGRIVAWAAEPA